MKGRLLKEKVFAFIETQFKDKETMEKLNSKIFQPIINNIFIQIYPYFILCLVIVISLFVILFLILFLNIRGIYIK